MPAPMNSIADWRKEPAKRSKKWLSTLARTPPTPTGSVVGDASAIVTPSGRMSRVQVTKARFRSEEHTSELQTLMSISYAVFCLKKKATNTTLQDTIHNKIGQIKVIN